MTAIDGPAAAAHALVRQVHAGELSAYELAERALLAAARVDAAIARGERPPLAGVTVTVKDSMWLEGEPAEMACPALRGHVAPETAEAVRRVEAAGAVVFGRTTTSELCRGFATETETHGRTRNPLDLERSVGASSGGAAAALAAGVGCVALGSDESGSIRLPAAFCGVVGHRPTHGVIPTTPGFPQGAGMNTFGPVARSARDALLMLETLAAGGGRERLGRGCCASRRRSRSCSRAWTTDETRSRAERAPTGGVRSLRRRRTTRTRSAARRSRRRVRARPGR